MNDTPTFRSVLPHEPLRSSDTSFGYLHLQGSFEPRSNVQFDLNESQEHCTVRTVETTSFWDASTLEQALSMQIRKLPAISAIHDKLESVRVLDKAPPFTKIRLVFSTPGVARFGMSLLRIHKVSPADVLDLYEPSTPGLCKPKFHARPLQVTQITTSPMLPMDIAWTRSNPPKFRRLLSRPGDDPAILAKERTGARFAYIAGLLVNPQNAPDCWKDSHAVSDAIRQVINTYDSSGIGVEVFVSSKKAALYCHVGMRSPADAVRLISGMQGQQVQWLVACTDESGVRRTKTLSSGNLFLDYADITNRSAAKTNRSLLNGYDIEKGEPARSECTSATESVNVPGLALIRDFISTREEEVLMAALVGPHAPWAPFQSTPSNHVVKRRVQHYGYVFDYETADVLRNRSEHKANCPAMPSIPQDAHDASVDEFIAASVEDRRGFDVLAGVIERVRQENFAPILREATGEGAIPSQMTFPEINQLTVNEYKEGSGIGSHIDTLSAFADGLISISLNSGIVMEFRQQSIPEKNSTPLRKLVYLPPRSLLLMSGPARFEWEHMIVTRKTDTHDGIVIPRGRRVSLTLRTALHHPSSGSKPLPRVESSVFPPQWGSENIDGSHNVPLLTPSTERDHVHAVYDAIATQWHHTRGKRGVLWPGATQFLKKLPPGSIVADVGCGDGKYFPAIWEEGSFVIGTDISEPLLRMSIGAGPENRTPQSCRVRESRRHLRIRPTVAVADCMSLPLRSEGFDAAICVAVMHHLSTVERRVQCIHELARIVKVGGTINIQAWAMDQQEGSRRTFHANDVFVPFNAQPKYLDKMESEQGPSSASKSVAEMYANAYHGAEFNEKKGLVVFQRYCHLYRNGELEELAAQVARVQLIRSGYESGNYFIILQVV